MSQPTAPAASSASVGTEMVLRVFDVPNLRAIPGWQEDEDTPLGRSADDVAHLARRLDIVQQTLVSVAAGIRRDMDRVIGGDDADMPLSHGVLSNSGQSLDFLVVRRSELFQALERAVGLHRLLAAHPPAPPPEQKPAAPAQQKEKKLTATQRATLEAVATGKVTMHASEMRKPMQVGAAGVQVDRKALNVLFQRKLVERDTRTSLFVGQTVRPTAAGLRMLAVLNAAPAAAPTAAVTASPRSTAPAATARRPR
ncbi:hypothetical protein GCM10009759_67540 [Kitasatospora saccharophila]|uniref:Uncharacterized protein n=1 Tax=Kitasatospora saccharophila TaxID=407973 RepID=A0ABP5JKV5_9ACTN